ncbi:S-adenosyl-L-methionine-dependent methyltransferase [Mycena epipterygia]|nr:S-adenosyl-L-methionine-dependent methyltransferase [Mycena epipterygia]
MPHLKGGIRVLSCDMTAPEHVLVQKLNEVHHEHDHPTSIRWGNCLSHPGYYASVIMDGVIYKIGDIVSVNPGEDVDEERATAAGKYCANLYARRVWFIQIEYFFDDETERDYRGQPTKKLHGVWFAHGSETILQQVAHSQELFLLEECDDINVSSIFRKCDVRKLWLEEVEPPDDGDEKATSYFNQLVWDGGECEFRSPPTAEEQLRVKHLLPPHKPCTNCGFVAEETLHMKIRPLGPELAPNGFTQYEHNYHSGDFVYIKPASSSATPLLIGQIFEIEGLQPGELREEDVFCSVRYFKRYTEDWMDSKDERRLYYSRHINKVNSKDIDGVCFVKFIDEADVDGIQAWIKEDRHLDRFYTNSRKSRSGDLVAMDKDYLKICSFCVDEYDQEVLEMEQYDLRNEPISVLDIFSGAGGLSEGMRRTGFFEAKWAIEQSTSAAQTFTANHPKTNVLCADVNAVLKYISEKQEGKVPDPVRSSDGSIIPDEKIPGRGDLELVSGGPPCQPFSGANMYKREDDMRSTLPYTMLSFAEVLEPTFFLLENVTGLLHHAVTVSGTGQRVDKAAIKLICRVLIALGYQVRFKVLQAGQYGAPQDRERIIFVAAKRGHKLPDFPIPTHAFFKAARRWKIPIRPRYRIRPPTRSRGEDHLFASHPAVTVDDAIGDLPAFDWVNPHRLIDRTTTDAEEEQRRQRAGILQCNVFKEPVGFPDPVAYATKPQTRYQRAMRRQDGLPVSHHVTKAFSDLVVESTTMVPLKPWSNHRFLPQEILPKIMRKSEDHANFYGRLDGSAYFKTAMTAPKPHGKKYFIHPSQKRALSLREFARSQGFPDGYTLCSSESTPAARLQDYFKQIGNAVPLPLAAALGRSIGAALVHDWRERRQRDGSVEL